MHEGSAARRTSFGETGGLADKARRGGRNACLRNPTKTEVRRKMENNKDHDDDRRRRKDGTSRQDRCPSAKNAKVRGC